VTTGCNGLSTIALFTGFVLAYPGTWRRRALFIPLGALFVFVVNVVRVAVIVVILDRLPQHEDVAHVLVAPSVFYVTVFVLWVVWVRYGGGPSAEPEAPAPAPAPQPA
jgi:exosortase family protein XrtF